MGFLDKIKKFFKKAEQVVQHNLPEEIRETFREDYSRQANEVHQFIVDWLRNKDYPLRKGSLPPAPPESRYEPLKGKDLFKLNEFRSSGQTATARLWPGDKPLAESQVLVIEDESDFDFGIRFENEAQHAKFFFQDQPEHEYGGKMSFWAGKPLPWHPPLVDKQPARHEGFVYTLKVNHPGHMNYLSLLLNHFDREFYQRFDDTLLNSARRAIDNSIGDLFY